MSRNIALVCAAVLAALICLLAGCGGGGGSSISGRYGTLQFTAATDKSIYNSGERVNFVFTATNTGSSSVNIGGGGIFSLADPVPIAARIERNGQLVTWILNNGGNNTYITLAPGESKTGRAYWDQTDSNSVQAPVGAYTLTVMLGVGQVGGVTFTNLTDALAAPPISIVIH